MTRWTSDPLGAFGFRGISAVQFDSEFTPPIPIALLQNRERGIVEIIEFQISRFSISGVQTIRIWLNFHQDNGQRRIDLTDAWEQSPTAITIQYADTEWVIPGPFHALSTRPDNADPYRFDFQDAAIVGPSVPFFALSDEDLSAARMILDDGLPEPADPPQPPLLTDRGTDYLIFTVSPADTGQARINGGPWIQSDDAGVIRFDGLTPDTAYDVENSYVSPNGITSYWLDPVLFRTLAERPPGPVTDLQIAPTGQTTLSLSWQPPLDPGTSPITEYQICVVNEDGTEDPFETAGPNLRQTIRGLALGHTYGFRVRARSDVGPGPASAIIRETAARSPVLAIPPGHAIPVIDADRQALVIRLAGIACLLRLWWQPSDRSWWAALEAPVNTPVVSGRRLALNAGLLDRLDILPGNIVLRGLGEPGRDAWRTHRLVWEPNE